MRENFYIIETVNLDRILKKIDNYINQNDYPPYLFMSKETADAIEHEVAKNNPILYDASLSNKSSKDGIYGEFIGYKIYINNDLNFGMVEIR